MSYSLSKCHSVYFILTDLYTSDKQEKCSFLSFFFLSLIRPVIGFESPVIQQVLQSVSVSISESERVKLPTVPAVIWTQRDGIFAQSEYTAAVDPDL